MPAAAGSSEQPTQLLTAREVAERLGVAERTVWVLISRGELEVVRLGAKATRVPEDVLEAYIAAARRRGQS